jgi:hypothetical protein
LLASFRVPRAASRAEFYLKDSEIPELDSSILGQSLDQFRKQLLNDLFDLLLGQAQLIRDRSNDFFLGHKTVVWEANGTRKTDYSNARKCMRRKH